MAMNWDKKSRQWSNQSFTNSTDFKFTGIEHFNLLKGKYVGTVGTGTYQGTYIPISFYGRVGNGTPVGYRTVPYGTVPALIVYNTI